MKYKVYDRKSQNQLETCAHKYPLQNIIYNLSKEGQTYTDYIMVGVNVTKAMSTHQHLFWCYISCPSFMTIIYLLFDLSKL